MLSFDDETLEKLFGAEDAENEKPDRLKAYFFRNKAYENLTAKLPIRVLVGHKGVGKSALLKMSYLESSQNGKVALWIRPDDIKDMMSSSETNLNKMIESWKSGILDIVFKKFVQNIGLTESDDPSSLRRRSINALFDAIKEYVKANTSQVVTATAQALVASYSVNEEIIVYIDDLDRGWEAKESDIRNVSALLNAIRDICGADERLKFKIALRSDVYFLVRTSDESTDKIERNVIWLTWDNHEILVTMAKRISLYFNKSIDENALLRQSPAQIANHLYDVIEPVFNGVGKWHNAPIYRVLLSLTRRRPRDLVKLLYGGGKAAFRNNNQKITTTDLRSTFPQYSNERMQDIINEFRFELPRIENLLLGMKPSRIEKKASDGFLYSYDKLSTKLTNLRSSHSFVFKNGRAVNTKSLAEFLYKIDFITARKDEEGRIVRVFLIKIAFFKVKLLILGFSGRFTQLIDGHFNQMI